MLKERLSDPEGMSEREDRDLQRGIHVADYLGSGTVRRMAVLDSLCWGDLRNKRGKCCV